MLPTMKSYHCYGIPHIIGGKLTIIGGMLSATKKRTNKVSTFDKASHTWTSYYPNLLSDRYKPGVTTHLEHVIVTGGMKDDRGTQIHNDIEVFIWIENPCRRKVSVTLPGPSMALSLLLLITIVHSGL